MKSLPVYTRPVSRSAGRGQRARAENGSTLSAPSPAVCRWDGASQRVPQKMEVSERAGALASRVEQASHALITVAASLSAGE